MAHTTSMAGAAAKVTIYTNSSNTFLVAVPGKSSGNLHFLGLFDHVEVCRDACLAMMTPSRCESFSYYHAAYLAEPVLVEPESGRKTKNPEGAVQRHCYAMLSPQWSPTPRNGSTAGRILWPCRNSHDCSMNGACRSDGVCTCYAPWEGDRCDLLGVLPTGRSAGYGSAAAEKGVEAVSAWKGSVLKGEDGQWHMWVSELTHHCGICAWIRNSRVVHAVASTAEGPFRRVPGTLFGENSFATEPHVVRAPSGEFAMFLTANFTGSGEPPCHCVNGSTGPSDCGPWKAGGGRTASYVTWSKSAFGPWSKPSKIFGNYSGSDTNLSPVILPNGSAITFWRRWETDETRRPVQLGGQIYLATATDWRNGSTYVQRHDRVFPELGPMGTEDSDIYYDRRSASYHSVFHHMYGLPFPLAVQKWWLCAATGHAFSPDGLAWTYTGVAYGTCTDQGVAVPYRDGGAGWASRQESPVLVLEPSGQPTHLVTAVNVGDGQCSRPLCANKGDRSYALVQPLRTA